MIGIISDICAVIPAAGYGTRMKTKNPKQYLLIENKTILEHAVIKLLKHHRISRTIIVINSEDNFFSKLPLANHPKIITVNGGTERANSVLAGIQAVDDAKWILVHDAVRPCLHQTDLSRILETANEISCTGSILATPVRDTIKYVQLGKNFISHTIKRINLWHALTPQIFPRKLLYKCLISAINEKAIITDESSALEYCGFYPKLIRGRADNIKVTYPEDLKIAEFYFKNVVHSLGGI